MMNSPGLLSGLTLEPETVRAVDTKAFICRRARRQKNMPAEEINRMQIGSAKKKGKKKKEPHNVEVSKVIEQKVS